MGRKRTEFEFDVAVSFAGEDRPTVDRFVALLKAKHLRVFYDTDEQGKLWGKDLYEHLDEVYKHKARYCVMFISEHYARKLWTNHERKSAQERAFKENREYILPVRFDDTVIPGIRGTVGYLDLRHMPIEQVAELTIEKIQDSTEAKSSGSKPKKATETAAKPKKIASKKVDNSGDWILLNDGFFQAQLVERPDDKKFTVTIVSQDATTDSRIEAIRSHRNTGNRSISFAYANDAFIVRCESATSAYEGGVHKWKINLTKEDVEYGGGYMESAFSDGTNSYTAEDIVRLRAERILLASQLPKAQRQSMFGGYSMIESFVQGMHTPLKVTSSPIVELAKKMPRTDGEQFMRFARLVSLFYLKAAGIVERIEQLTMGPLTSNSVHVVFRGVRKRRYTNQDPEVINIEGDCPLP